MIGPAVDPSPWTTALGVLVVTICVTAVAGMDRFVPVALGGLLPVVALAATAVNACGVLLHLAIVRRGPGLRQGSLWRIAALAQGAVLVSGAGLFLGLWATRLQSTLLGSTPRVVIVLLIAGVATYAVILGFETTMRLAALVGLISLPVFLLIAVTIPANAHWDRLLSTPPTLVQWPAVAILLFAPRGYVMLAALAGRRAAAQPLPSLVLSVVGGILLGLFLTLPGLVFGHELAASYAYPFYQVTATSRSIYLPFHEVEAFVDVLWQMIDAVIVAIYLAAALRAFGVRGPLPRPPWALGAVVAACLLISAPTPTPAGAAQLMTAWSVAVAVAFLVLPLAALATARVRVRGATA